MILSHDISRILCNWNVCMMTLWKCTTVTIDDFVIWDEWNVASVKGLVTAHRNVNVNTDSHSN